MSKRKNMDHFVILPYQMFKKATSASFHSLQGHSGHNKLS